MLQDVIVNGKMKDEQNKDGGSTTTQTRPGNHFFWVGEERVFNKKHF